ncbi:hypothetical protein [Streptomyces sp. NPDC056323]|uniref:hypothetical protein n=1 Tax=Streptomyces sp. NPDC056323 TaxID=3345784 RepID=UPI0035D8791F
MSSRGRRSRIRKTCLSVEWRVSFGSLGSTGPRLRPHHLVLAVGDEGGPARVSARLEPVLAARVGEALSGAVVVRERRVEGEPYTRVESDLVVEVLDGSGRHGTLTVTRMR